MKQTYLLTIEYNYNKSKEPTYSNTRRFEADDMGMAFAQLPYEVRDFVDGSQTERLHVVGVSLKLTEK